MIDRRKPATAVVAVALTLTLGAAALHFHDSSQGSPSLGYDCATCVLAQAPSTLAAEPVSVVPSTETVFRSSAPEAGARDAWHRRSETTRGPPRQG